MTCYKIGVNIPAGMEQDFMDSLNEVMTPLYPGYDRCFSWWPVKGTWRPLDGSNPYRGTIGKIETADEMRIEFAIHEKDLCPVLKRISDIHPYEEPAIDVIPMIPWKDILENRISSCSSD